MPALGAEGGGEAAEVVAALLALPGFAEPAAAEAGVGEDGADGGEEGPERGGPAWGDGDAGIQEDSPQRRRGRREERQKSGRG